MKATGTFEVKLNPLQGYALSTDASQLGRMSIDKTFKGDLEAVSRGEMLTAMTSTKGSAAYVAIEQVGGTLSGRKGSFILQHAGTMDRGKDSLFLEVVPDSGQEGLHGLSGKMQIRAENGVHHYVFEYVIA